MPDRPTPTSVSSPAGSRESLFSSDCARQVTEAERLSYHHGGHFWLVAWGLFSSLLLLIGLGRFTLIPLVGLLALPGLLLNGLYLLISYLLMLTPRRFKLSEHEQLQQRWESSGVLARQRVDVFLPVCGESHSVILQTWQHVQQLDWPGPLQVYVLDDSPTDALRALAEGFRFHYLRREDRSGRKSGNLRHGFAHSTGDSILLLDADFAPHPRIIHELIPYLLEDPHVAIVQSPQYFDVTREMGWVQAGAGYVQELFYRLIQPARDYWGAAVCTGSCALYRRTALQPLAGAELIDHSEDLWTGFELLHRQQQIRYVPLVLAKGICPSTLSAFLSQQSRWCLGSLSLVMSRRFWNSRLTVPQKLCFASGWIYYVATAFNTLLTPLPPLIMAWFFPDWLHWSHLVFAVPALLYTPFFIGWWSRYPLGFHFLTTREVSCAAHLAALLESLSGHGHQWKVTGAAASRQAGRLAQGALLLLVTFSLTTFLVVWGVCFQIVRNEPGRWPDLLAPLLFTLIHALICSRALFFTAYFSVFSAAEFQPLAHKVQVLLSGTVPRARPGDIVRLATLSLLLIIGGLGLAGMRRTSSTAAVPSRDAGSLSAELPLFQPSLDGEADFSPYTTVDAFPGVSLQGIMRMREHPARPGTYFVADFQGRIFWLQRSGTGWSKSAVADLSGSELDWLYSFAIHPHYPEDPRLFITYRTSDAPGRTVYSRVSAVTIPQNSWFARPQESILIEQVVSSREHLAGDLAFDPSGCLLISCGDNELTGQHVHPQRLDTGFFSGIFRIDVNGRSDRNHPPVFQVPGTRTANYFIPNDNPFVGIGNVLEEFWSLGFRNPFRISVDPQSGRLWIGEVGEDQTEQVELAGPGTNHLWPLQEGRVPHNPSEVPVRFGEPTEAVHEYPHADMNLCVIGGCVIEGPAFPELQGRYLFGDNRSGRIWSLDRHQTNPPDFLMQLPFGSRSSSLTSISTDRSGNLFTTHFNSSPSVTRLIRAAPIDFPEKLSQTGIFDDLPRLTLRPDFIPYEVNAPLWSDGLQKSRWVRLPPGKRIENRGRAWSLPPGTLLVKHFAFQPESASPSSTAARSPADSSVKDSFAKEAPVPIETRVLVIQSDGTVRGASYVWDATQTEAHLQHTRTSIPSPDGSDVSFRIPSPQDCRFCHHPGTPVLAFTPEQLNRPDASSGNQLVTLSQRHLFREAITLRQARRQFHLSALQDESVTLEQRGRSYLHANCAFCHSPGGVEHLRMDLRFLKPDADNSLLGAPAQLGHFAIDEELAPWLIAPGDPDHSAILRRLRTRHERHAMPYLGRSRVDHAAVAILEEWIRSLPCESSETP